MSESGEVAVLIPAAGEGTRLGGRRKQFRILGNKPVLVQTLYVFERHPDVDHIIVATPEEAVEPLRDELRRVGITKLQSVVAGGATRQESVSAALAHTSDDVEVILVHDAVRPFVRLFQVSDIIQSVRRHGAAALAVPVTDSVRRSDGFTFMETVPRENLYRMQTPQGFRRDWLVKAYTWAGETGVVATDDVELIQRAGFAVRCVGGSNVNVKITTRDDWDRAMQFWPVWEESLHLEDVELEGIRGGAGDGRKREVRT